MTQEITISLKDMETYLEPEEYQAFLKAKEEVDEYTKRYRDYEIKKLSAEWARDECQKRRDEAKTNAGRSLWHSERFIFVMEALMPAPYKPTYYFVEHDQYLDLVRKRKLEQLEKEERRKAEEEAERRREEERKKREQQMMHAAMRRKMLADSEWEQFQKTFNSTIKDLKHQLANPKPPKSVPGCSPEVLNYHPELWCDLTLLSEDEARAWAKPKILDRIPQLLIPFVTWESASEILAIPKIKYELLGVPSLTWNFDIYVKAKVDLWLKESTITKEFEGFKYVSPIKAQKIGSFFLGYAYWDSEEGFSTPIALLALLVEGELEGLGIEVIEGDPSHTVYTVEGFDERYVEVHKDFRKFIRETAKEKPLAQALLDKGIIYEDTAKLVEAKWDQPLPVSGNMSDAAGSELESAVAKLVELGLTEAVAKKEVETTVFPKNATVDDIVKIILEKSY